MAGEAMKPHKEKTVQHKGKTKIVMIDYINGTLAELAPTKAVVEAGGVGYELNISLTTYSALEGKAEAKLYVYEDIREDAWVLFGFSGKSERELFLYLKSVSGIGGNTARTILSSYSVGELCHIIANGEDGMLKKVKGIGGKTAQRIIVELQDKLQNSALLADSANAVSAQAVNAALNEEGEEALGALITLGFSPAPAKKAVKTLLERNPKMNAEELIKQALKMI